VLSSLRKIYLFFLFLGLMFLFLNMLLMHI